MQDEDPGEDEELEEVVHPAAALVLEVSVGDGDPGSQQHHQPGNELSALLAKAVEARQDERDEKQDARDPGLEDLERNEVVFVAGEPSPPAVARKEAKEVSVVRPEIAVELEQEYGRPNEREASDIEAGGNRQVFGGLEQPLAGRPARASRRATGQPAIYSA